MIEINLLPWREELIKRRKKFKKILVINAIVLIVLILVIHKLMDAYQQNLIEKITKLNEVVQLQQPYNRIAISDLTIDEKSMIHKKRKLLQQLLNDINKINNDDICFSQVKINNNRIFFSGHANSAADFSRFILMWPAVGLFSEIQLEKLFQLPNQLWEFQFHGNY